MRIAITGASGYVGGHLTRFFKERGYEVIPLGRELFREQNFDVLCRSVEGVHVIVNLAGAPINKRWTKAYKQELYDSRIPVTRQLVEAVRQMTVLPELLISASAVGYYPTSGAYDEYNGRQGDGFLASLCADWEKEARRRPSDIRLVIARFGIVLSKDGGALKQMLRLQRLSRMGAVIGSGDQYFPWVSVYDLCRSFDFMIRNKQLEDVVNLVSPQRITQKQLAHALASADGFRWTVRVPGFFFRLMFGEGASFLTEGQNVIPAKLPAYGFVYEHPTIERLMGADHLR